MIRNAVFSVGNPKSQSPFKKKGEKDKSTSYLLNDGSVIITQGNSVTQRSPSKPTSQRVLTKKEKQIR